MQALGDRMVSGQVRSHSPMGRLQAAKLLGPGQDPEVGQVQGGHLLPGLRCVPVTSAVEGRTAGQGRCSAPCRTA